MEGKTDKSLFFLILAMACVWVILDQAFGDKHLESFLATLFPFMASESSSSQTVTAAEDVENHTGDTSAETDKEKAMKNDNPTFYANWKADKGAPYTPAVKIRYEAWLRKWGVEEE